MTDKQPMETKIALVKQKVKRLDKDLRKLEKGISKLRWTLGIGAFSVTGSVIWATIYLAGHAVIQLK